MVATHICQSKSLHMDSYQNPKPKTQPTTHNHLSNNPTPPPTNLNFTILLLLGWRLPAHRRGAFLYIKWSVRHNIGSCPPSSWFSAGLQMTPLCSGRGSNPTWNGYNISSQHMRGAWQPSYAVDGHMAPYSAHYHHLSCPRFGNLLKLYG